MPKMLVHELHPSVVHAPLALLPTAALLDLRRAVAGPKKGPDVGPVLWWAGAATGLFAGLAGMAASRQVKTDDQTEQMMWLHGIGNVGIVAAALGMAGWRSRHRPTLLQAMLGLGACAAAVYTAYLGGELVYSRGVGVKTMPTSDEAGVSTDVPLFSRRAPAALALDALGGLSWLVRRGARALTGRERLDRRAVGVEAREPPTAYPS